MPKKLGYCLNTFCRFLKCERKFKEWALIGLSFTQDALARFVVEVGTDHLKCIYTFAVTFSKMEKLVKFLILH